MKVKLGSGIKRFFTKIGGWIKKHKVLSVIILLAVIGIIFFVVKSAGKKEEIPIVDNTEVLTRQTISNIVSTSGKIVSADSRQIILEMWLMKVTFSAQLILRSFRRNMITLSRISRLQV